jgi:hypothetical protein
MRNFSATLIGFLLLGIVSAEADAGKSKRSKERRQARRSQSMPASKAEAGPTRSDWEERNRPSGKREDSGDGADGASRRGSSPPFWRTFSFGFLGDSEGPSSSATDRDDRPKGPPPKPRAERMPKRVVTSTRDFNLADNPIRVAVLGRGDLKSVAPEVAIKVRGLARLAASRKLVLITGGGNGLPREAEIAASAAGGETWAISAVKDVDEQLLAQFDVSSTSILYPTGTGGGAGAILREGPLVQLANLRTYFNGGPGTFGELIAGLHAPGVLVLADGAGGVSGGAAAKILPYVGVPANVRVVTARDEETMLDEGLRALGELHASGVKTTPDREELYVPQPHRPVVTESQRSDRTVMAFLVDDGGSANPAAVKKTSELVDKAMSGRINDKRPMLITKDSKAGARLLTEAVTRHDVDAAFVKHEVGDDRRVRIKDPETGQSSKGSVLIRYTGKGKGVGEFATHHEIVEDADVVFVTSAYFKNLAGLAFVLRQSKKSVVAVLEMQSTRSDKLREILLTATGRYALSDRFVFSSDPERLLDKVRDALKPKAPKFKYKSIARGGDDDLGEWVPGHLVDGKWILGRFVKDAAKAEAREPAPAKPTIPEVD